MAEVIPGGAAEKAGVKVGDVILQLNGYEAKTFAQLQEQLAQYTPGNTVQMTLSRDGKEKVADVVLQNSYGDVSLKTGSGILGAEVQPLTQAERYRYRLNKGVKITELKSAGLTEGYIIVKINDMVIYDSEDLERALKAAGDEGVFVTAVSPRGRVEYFAFSLLD